MEKSILEEGLLEKLNRNFDDLSKYIGAGYIVFHDLTSLIDEIAKCLILELHVAAITLTNHTLERLLKLALIKKEVGIESKPPEDWNSIYQQPKIKKYQQLVLSKTIQECRLIGLITANEEAFLDKAIRDSFRNGFSHADYGKILDGVADTLPGYTGSSTDGTEVSLDPKSIPVLQNLIMTRFAEQNAKEYFETVMVLLRNIEERLVRNETE